MITTTIVPAVICLHPVCCQFSPSVPSEISFAVVVALCFPLDCSTTTAVPLLGPLVVNLRARPPRKIQTRSRYSQAYLHPLNVIDKLVVFFLRLGEQSVSTHPTTKPIHLDTLDSAVLDCLVLDHRPYPCLLTNQHISGFVFTSAARTDASNETEPPILGIKLYRCGFQLGLFLQRTRRLWIGPLDEL
jgi:hypothetical protein